MIAQQFTLIRRNEIKRMLVLRQPCFDGNYLYHEEHEALKELLNKAFKSLLQQPYSFNLETAVEQDSECIMFFVGQGAMMPPPRSDRLPVLHHLQEF